MLLSLTLVGIKGAPILIFYYFFSFLFKKNAIYFYAQNKLFLPIVLLSSKSIFECMDTFYFKPEPDIKTTKDNLIEIQSCNCLLNPSLSILKSYADVSLNFSSEHISFFYKHTVRKS